MKAPLVCGMLLLAVAAGAAALRFPRAEARPMHADEAVQAARARDLFWQGRYVYDPNEFHGPTLQYATAAVLWIGGHDDFAETTEATYRLVPIVFSVGSILLLLLLIDGLGKSSAVGAGLLLAISPAMVFYSRYYIHEMLLVFFTLATIAAGWRYVRDGRLRWCLAAGVGVGLMQATKETAAITYVAMIGAWMAAGLWNWHVDRSRDERFPAKPFRHWLFGLGMAVLVAVVLLSSFFTNLRGPVDGVLTYLPWLQRAGETSAHAHPWHYYLNILAWWQVDAGPYWSEGLILALAAVGFVGALFPSAVFPSDASVRFVRWLGFCTLISIVAYAAIPYKTPWCLLQFLLGMILLAGVGATVLVRAMPGRAWRGIVVIGLLAAAGQLGWQSYRTSFEFFANPKNPYVYAQTRPKFVQLGLDVQAIAEASADDPDFSIQVIWHDPYYWPLPWTLRRYGPIGRWDHVPDGPAAHIIVASAEFNIELDKKISATHQMPSFFEIRPGVFVVYWVRKDVWETYLRKLGRIE